ncbi:MAG: universal stress protein [Rhodospirillales bacterium]
MAFRKILVAIDGSESQNAPLALALALAAHGGVAVDVLHVRIDPLEAVSFAGEGMAGEVIPEIMDMTQQQSASRAEAARAAFERACEEASIRQGAPVAGVATARYVEEEGREDEEVVRMGRLVDLIVVARPSTDPDPAAQSTLNAALFESGHPVLIPGTDGSAIPFRRVLIAWNGSAEAARAVSLALPLLAEADEVTVAAPAADGEEEGPQPLVDYLACHGITAGVRPLNPHRGAGEAVLEAAAGFDLLVMGAYTHSRLWQLILGGVTRRMLEHARLPLFMAH